jgi:pantetheine-phosphate adenylyltransferase
VSEGQIAVYPASFDPITNGHLDLIYRGARVFDQLIVALATNVEKTSLFSVEERLEMIREVVGRIPNVEVDVIETLLVDYMRSRNSRIVIRGLRAVSDFEYEFEMAMMNSHMYPELETIFLMTSERWFFVSSSRLREIVRFGADASEFVPEIVNRKLKEKLWSSRS